MRNPLETHSFESQKVIQEKIFQKKYKTLIIRSFYGDK